MATHNAAAMTDNTNWLTNALLNVPEFRSDLLSMITPSETSMLMEMTKVPMTNIEIERNTVIIREFPWMEDFVKIALEMGMRPFLFGTDLLTVMYRMSNPIEESEWVPRDACTLWLGVQISLSILDYDISIKRLVQAFKNMIMSPDIVIVEENNSNVVVETVGDRRTRIIITNLRSRVSQATSQGPTCEINPRTVTSINRQSLIHTVFKHAGDDIINYNAMSMVDTGLVRTMAINFGRDFNTVRECRGRITDTKGYGKDNLPINGGTVTFVLHDIPAVTFAMQIAFREYMMK